MDPLDRLLATEEIRTLRIKYAHLLDSNNIDRLDEVFTSDAIVDAGRGQWEGLENVIAGLKEAYAAYDQTGDGIYPFHHAITNHWVEFTGPTIAEGRSYLIDLQTDPSKDRWILLGTYADEYRIQNDGWRISRTRLDITWPEPAIGGGLPGNNDLELPHPTN
ncbi:MAG: nuclear transport factor 2 family protein [Rhodococcus sp. (in: high G+C Gram-positive bacteria)]|uniref:nuclear transport factor 2 family protein n=1 Tax=Rhodococcus sp. TaxID=1831 RepID=UPI0012171FF6|nr:nuclear transport factor 2 family protein [Rhodococcus sp. (in: high G+C Gram-positive bacteria)]RZL24656.1 MAG: nuclear transport factor 2 family protein [Rhodococcus sp. (in: high G+C Gram-positive bacteria)]